MLQLDFSPFPEIKTKRLFLRRMTLNDAHELFKLRSSEQVMKYIDRKRAKKIEDAEILLDSIENDINNNNGIMWGITINENPGRIIGNIGYWRIMKEHYRSEIGYMLHPSFWRNGIMKEAINAIIDFGFNKINLHSIEAHINSENSASGKLLESAGFIKEAHFREDFFFDGTFRDTIIYSRLRHS
jgi:ribosomal-protein-alanine N-acetyltransferase